MAVIVHVSTHPHSFACNTIWAITLIEIKLVKHELYLLLQWMASGKCATLKSLDLDSSDNVTEDMLGKFLDR